MGGARKEKRLAIGVYPEVSLKLGCWFWLPTRKKVTRAQHELAEEHSVLLCFGDTLGDSGRILSAKLDQALRA